MDTTRAKPQDGTDEQRAGAAARKRGARPGNTNALKHGFYSPRFTRRKISRLDGQPAHPNLQDEINRMKVLILRAFNKLDRRSETYQKDVLNLLQISGKVIVIINDAAQTQRLSGQKDGDPAGQFNEMIKEIMNEPNASQ